MPKLRGLADFAETFGAECGRIEAVAKVGDTLRVLDLTKESVRKAVRDGADAKALYDGRGGGLLIGATGHSLVSGRRPRRRP